MFSLTDVKDVEGLGSFEVVADVEGLDSFKVVADVEGLGSFKVVTELEVVEIGFVFVLNVEVTGVGRVVEVVEDVDPVIF